MPLWSFGHGLSYSNFSYADLRLSQSSGLQYEDSLNVTVAVTNNGPYDGQEVVQVYLTDMVSSVVTPNQFLAGFTKVSIP